MARAVVRCLTIGNGTTGSATRDSTQIAMPSSTAPAPTMAKVCQDTQSKVLSTNDTQTSSTLIPAAISEAPT